MSGAHGVSTGDVIGFWFSDEVRQYWWGGPPSFDEELRTRFAEAHAAAARGELDHWAETAEGALALVILLDQLTRNLHRGSGAAWSQDVKALAIARQAVAAGHHAQLDIDQQTFLFMPFMHAEDAEAQAEGITLFRTLDDPNILFFARLHQAVVERFGRFPSRDGYLGRETEPGTWDILERHGLTFGVKRPK